jgi:hypothetical protein
MSKPLYVCTICSEDFTRKSDGDRHNKNYHSKKGEIIGFIDYMIGRVKNAIPSNPDKLIRVPLKFDEVIELGAQRENHWASRVIKEEVTPIESHELMEFLMIQISTYGIFRVKSLSESQPRGVPLDLYFMYVSRYSPDKLPSVVLVLQT